MREKVIMAIAAAVALLSLSMETSAALNTCPPHVKVVSPLGDIKTLPIDGIFCYKDGAGELYFSSIKTHSPKKAPADAKGLGRITFTPNGEWVFGILPAGDLACVKTDASAVWKLGVKGGQCGVWFHSPKEKPAEKIYEVAYLDPGLTIVWAQLIDFSGTTPKLVGTRRKIGDGLPKAGGTYGEEFSAAGQHFAWDSRVIKTEGPSVIYTIPDKGNGIATKDMYYKSYYTFNCATALEQTGRMWVTNWGRLQDPANPDCIPASQGWHTGFAIMKTKLNTETVVKAVDYVMKPASGAVSVNWPMEKFEGQRCRWLHSDGDKAAAQKAGVAEFFAGPWTNHEDYMTVSMSKGNPEDKQFLLQWKTNIWYSMTPKGTRSGGGAAWFSGQKYPVDFQTGNAIKEQRNLSHGKATLLTAFREINKQDMIGRTVDYKANKGKAGGIRISRATLQPDLR